MPHFFAWRTGYARADDDEQINGVDNSVRLWDLRMLSGVHSQMSQHRPVISLVDAPEHPRNPDGDPVLHVDMEPGVVVSAHADHAIRIWELGLP